VISHAVAVIPARWASTRFPGKPLAVLAGEPIVLVATASPHRAAALESCAFLIDWLKTKAPFWKLEETADGEAAWVDARSADDEAATRWD